MQRNPEPHPTAIMFFVALAVLGIVVFAVAKLGPEIVFGGLAVLGIACVANVPPAVRREMRRS